MPKHQLHKVTKVGKSLRIGDVVRLKSGGPEMTITDISKDGILRCTWFDAVPFTMTSNRYELQVAYDLRPDALDLIK